MKYIHIVGGKYNWLVEGGAVEQPRPQGFSLAPPILLGRNPGNEVGCRIHFHANDSNERILPFPKFFKSLETSSFEFWWTVRTGYLLPCPGGLSYGTAVQ